VILLIISNSFLYNSSGFCQTKFPFNDSSQLRREIDSVLAKHGLKSKGFAINVVSINQSGGQTAYSITNNYFSDPNYIPDSINYEFQIKNEGDKITYYFYPKRGSWQSPFIAYDSSIKNISIPISGFHTPLSLSLNMGDKSIGLIGDQIGFVCTKLNPIFVTLNKKDNQILVFGDYGYNQRYYQFINGKVRIVPFFQQ